MRKQVPSFGKPSQSEGYHNVLVRAGGVKHSITYVDSGDNVDSRLTTAQQQRRSTITSLAEQLHAATSDGRGTAYHPDRVALLVKKAGDNVSPENSRVVDWPLQNLDRAVSWAGTDDRGDRCLTTTAGQASTVIDTLEKTSGKAVAWRWNGDLYRVWPHPMLPDEKSCDALHTYFSFPPDQPR